MLSLNNAFGDDEARGVRPARARGASGADEVEYAAEPKFDGLAISLRYERRRARRRRDARRRRRAART